MEENPNGKDNFKKNYIDLIQKQMDLDKIKKDKKKQFTEWGKLGGRPKIEHRKIHQLNLKFTEEEYSKIILKAKEQNIKVNDYCRIILSEKTFPKAEENKTLIKYANNFSRIKNFMQIGIFNDAEKQRIVDEIDLLIVEIRDSMKWS